jgi:hypothetical protein
MCVRVAHRGSFPNVSAQPYPTSRWVFISAGCPVVIWIGSQELQNCLIAMAHHGLCLLILMQHTPSEKKPDVSAAASRRSRRRSGPVRRARDRAWAPPRPARGRWSGRSTRRAASPLPKCRFLGRCLRKSRQDTLGALILAVTAIKQRRGPHPGQVKTARPCRHSGEAK